MRSAVFHLCATVRWICEWTRTRGQSVAGVVTNGGGGGYRPVLKTFGEERFAKRIAVPLLSAIANSR